MERIKQFIFYFFVCFSLPLFSQSLSDKVSTWYWEERFAVADVNEDALLEKSELSKFSTEFAFYLDSKNFTSTDENGDGFLSFAEMIGKKNAEIGFRTTMENRQIRSLIAANPELANPTLVFLKSKPEITSLLLGNFTWMTQNLSLTEAIYTDKYWMNANPKANEALQRNLCWMASCPQSAKYLYTQHKNSISAPELIGWRADHLKFLRQNTLSEDLYLIDGYKAFIKVGKK